MYEFYEKVKCLIINKLAFSCRSVGCAFFMLKFNGQINIICLLKVLICR